MDYSKKATSFDDAKIDEKATFLEEITYKNEKNLDAYATLVGRVDRLLTKFRLTPKDAGSSVESKSQGLVDEFSRQQNRFEVLNSLLAKMITELEEIV